MAQVTTVIGIVAGVCTSVSLLPQLIKMIKERKATDISVWMLVTLLTGLFLWVWYGVRRKDLPLIFTNAFSVIINLLIIIFRYRFKQKEAG